MNNKNPLFKDLKKYKNLYKYAKHFLIHQEAEHGRYLPNLIIWFRDVLDRAGVEDVPAYFGWDEDMAVDFWSWGHNSRWNHTFSIYLESEPKEALEHAISLAEEFGDPDVEEIYFKEKEAV